MLCCVLLMQVSSFLSVLLNLTELDLSANSLTTVRWPPATHILPCTLPLHLSFLAAAPLVLPSMLLPAALAHCPLPFIFTRLWFVKNCTVLHPLSCHCDSFHPCSSKLPFLVLAAASFPVPPEMPP